MRATLVVRKLQCLRECNVNLTARIGSGLKFYLRMNQLATQTGGTARVLRVEPLPCSTLSRCLNRKTRTVPQLGWLTWKGS